MNFQESTTILNACAKKKKKKNLETYWKHHVSSLIQDLIRVADSISYDDNCYAKWKWSISVNVLVGIKIENIKKNSSFQVLCGWDSLLYGPLTVSYFDVKLIFF